MSSYGTAFVVDVPSISEFGASAEVRGAFEVGFRTVAPDGWKRLVVLVSAVELVDDILDGLRAAGQGRVAIAEDNDEFGACWVVAHAVDGSVQVVHRRYVLNADPESEGEVAAAVADPGSDPRELDQVGPVAAEASALLFGVPADPVVIAERQSATAWQHIGVVGGPFPWWDALLLPWPVPQDGQPLDW